MTKPSRSIAFAVLVLACALLPTGFISHEHDGDVGGHEHDCILCCLRDHSTAAPTAAPAPAAPAPLAPAPSSPRHRNRFRTAPDPHPTRGPPA